METDILKRAKAWASNDYFSKESRQEIQKLLDQNDHQELTERFYKSMEFGTGGIRGIIGAGYNRMNVYNVRKATQAMSNVLNQTFKKPSVAISYDSRNFSFEFAKEAASVFAANNIRVYIYKRLNPVALLSFAVRHFKASAGVMITASHNPPEYNGYKAYWNDGAQVIPPYDQNIIDAYNHISDYASIKSLPFEKALKNEQIRWIEEDTENLYFEKVLAKTIRPAMIKDNADLLKVVYTPIHGTGLVPCTTILQKLGFKNVLIVKEQTTYDGNFPTVKSPNPENAEALKLAVDLLNKENADFAVGTDPDDDRIGVALKHQDQIHYLSGNQLGTLMLHYIITGLIDTKKMPNHPYMVKTIVTSRLQDKIATHFKVRVENTLTGFKWICGKMREIEENHPEQSFLFGTEESFGFLNHDMVRDKDGCAPVALLCEMALFYKLKNMTLMDALENIYTEFGFHHEDLLNLHYLGKEGSEKIKRIMKLFRENTPKYFASETLISLEDYEISQRTCFQTNQKIKMDIPKSDVLGFYFASGNILYCRPSGTEPKIKFYTMIKETEGSLATMKQKAIQKTKELIHFIKEQADKA